MQFERRQSRPLELANSNQRCPSDNCQLNGASRVRSNWRT